jgi:hypothetical protein
LGTWKYEEIGMKLTRGSFKLEKKWLEPGPEVLLKSKNQSTLVKTCSKFLIIIYSHDTWRVERPVVEHFSAQRTLGIIIGVNWVKSLKMSCNV